MVAGDISGAGFIETGYVPMHSYYPKIMGWSGASGADNELCAMFDGSSQCTIVLPEECLGYGLVVPFLAYRFALWFRIMKT